MLLLLLILIPTLGAVIGALLPREGGAARWWAFWVSIATLLVGIVMAFQFDWRGGRELTWGMDQNNAFYLYNIQFGLKLGADAITMWLVLLTVGLQPLAVAASFRAIEDRQKQYYAWMTAL